MKTSPFPGMDPYLERRWGDVHVRLIAGISAALQPNLPPGLQALGQEEVRLEGDEDDQRYEPDVSVLQRVAAGAAANGGGPSVATVPAVLVRAVPVRRTRRWVEIIDTEAGDRRVTAIEVLSPANKSAGRTNREYLRKLRDDLAARVNVVEVDLLRSPRDHLLIPTIGRPDRRRPTTYYTCVNRATRRQYWEVYATPLQDPLPTVPVPCRKTDRDVPLPLQPVLDRAYVDGGHHHLDYAAPLRPRLPAADAAWAAERMAGRPA